MMIAAIGVVIVALVLIIVYFTHQNTVQSQGRDEYLKKLAQFVEGRLEKIREVEGGYRIEYDFEGVKFIFEDTYFQGFSRERLNKGHLKAFSRSSLTLTFTEREPKQKIVSGEVIIASKIPEEFPDETESKVAVPTDLKAFKVHASDPGLANRLMTDEKVVNIFRKFKNVDHRGFPSLSLRIVEGIVILEFHTEGGLKPNLNALRGQVVSIEDLSEKLLYIVHAINRQLK